MPCIGRSQDAVSVLDLNGGFACRAIHVQHPFFSRPAEESRRGMEMFCGISMRRLRRGCLMPS